MILISHWSAQHEIFFNGITVYCAVLRKGGELICDMVLAIWKLEGITGKKERKLV